VRLPFFLAAGFAGINFLFGLFLLPESLAKEKRRAFTWHRANPFRALKRAFAAKQLRGMLIVVFILMLAGYVYPSIWSYYGKEKFGWSLSTIGYSLAAFGLGVVFVQGFLIRWMLPVLGERRTIRFGIVATLLALVALAFTSSTLMVFAMIPLAALGEVAGPAISGYLSNKVSDSEQGDLQGVLGSIESLAAIFAPPVFTGLFKLFTSDGWPYMPGAPYLLAAAILVLALVIFQRQ